MRTLFYAIAKNLKYYRRKKNLTQSQLAEKCETSTNYIATIETTKKYPSPNTLEKIAKALDINAIDLFQLEIKNETSMINLELENIKEKLRISINGVLDDIIK